jgi:hypothetical protein
VLRRLGTRAELFVHDQPDTHFFLDKKQFPARKGVTYTHDEARHVLDRAQQTRRETINTAERPDAKRLLAKHFGIDESFFKTHGLLRAAQKGEAPKGTSLNRKIDEITAWADSRTTNVGDFASSDVPDSGSSQQ